jgi:hypothetical protein
MPRAARGTRFAAGPACCCRRGSNDRPGWTISFEEMIMTADFGRTDARSHAEGPVAKSIEEQTAKLPSDTFLWLAVGAITGSAVLQIAGNKHVSLFVGQWAPTFLLLGLYNKLVKQLGSDRTENAV